MKSDKERIELLHQRADKLRRERNRNHMIAGGSVGAFLLTALLVIGAQFGNSAVGTVESTYTASSLLSENVGGYVLAGVIAFMVGVIITVISKKHLEKKTDKKEEN